MPPDRSGSQLAFSPAAKRLDEPCAAVPLRCADAVAPTLGSSPAAATSASARDWRSAAIAASTVGLVRSASSTSALSSASPKRCHQAASPVADAACSGTGALQRAGSSMAAGGSPSAAGGATHAASASGRPSASTDLQAALRKRFPPVFIGTEYRRHPYGADQGIAKIP
ncbi:hypothetical protein MASR1M50_17980 [Burkholderiales bacterium]